MSDHKTRPDDPLLTGDEGKDLTRALMDVFWGAGGYVEAKGRLDTRRLNRADSYERWLGVVCNAIDHAPGQTMVRGQMYRHGRFAIMLPPSPQPQPPEPPRERLERVFQPSRFSPFWNPYESSMMRAGDEIHVRIRILEEFRIPDSQKEHFYERLKMLADGFADQDAWSQALEITSMVPSEVSDDIIVSPEAWLARMKTIRASATRFTQRLLPQLQEHPPELWRQFCVETALDWTHRTPALNRLTSSTLSKHLMARWETRLALEKHLRVQFKPSRLDELIAAEPTLATDATWNQLIASVYPLACRMARFSPYHSNIRSEPFDLIQDAATTILERGPLPEGEVLRVLQKHLAYAVLNAANRRRRRVEHKRRRMVGADNDLSVLPNSDTASGASPLPRNRLSDIMNVPVVRQKLQDLAPKCLPVFEILLLQDAGGGRKNFTNEEAARDLGYKSTKSFYNVRGRLIRILRDLDYLPKE